VFCSRRAEDDPLRARLQISFNRRDIANAAAYLYGNRGSVKNRPNDIVVTGPAIARAVKIHHMQAPRARALPAQSDRYGIVHDVWISGLGVVRMHEVEVGAVVDTLKNRVLLDDPHLVPAHVGDFKAV